MIFEEGWFECVFIKKFVRSVKRRIFWRDNNVVFAICKWQLFCIVFRTWNIESTGIKFGSGFVKILVAIDLLGIAFANPDFFLFIVSDCRLHEMAADTHELLELREHVFTHFRNEGRILRSNELIMTCQTASSTHVVSEAERKRRRCLDRRVRPN